MPRKLYFIQGGSLERIWQCSEYLAKNSSELCASIGDQIVLVMQKKPFKCSSLEKIKLEKMSWRTPSRYFVLEAFDRISWQDGVSYATFFQRTCFLHALLWCHRKLVLHSAFSLFSAYGLVFSDTVIFFSISFSLSLIWVEMFLVEMRSPIFYYENSSKYVDRAQFDLCSWL